MYGSKRSGAPIPANPLAEAHPMNLRGDCELTASPIVDFSQVILMGRMSALRSECLLV
jgi:hypothetical protein